VATVHVDRKSRAKPDLGEHQPVPKAKKSPPSARTVVPPTPPGAPTPVESATPPITQQAGARESLEDTFIESPDAPDDFAPLVPAAQHSPVPQTIDIT
jgi:hypothetical protein